MCCASRSLMGVPKEKIHEWIINHQNELVVARYSDIHDGQEIVNFFAKYLYPPYRERPAYRARNEFIRRIVAIYTRGKLRQELGAAVVLYAPMIWLADRMKELPHYLQRMVGLYDEAERLDARVVEYIAGRIESIEQLDQRLYDEAYVNTATADERRSQVNSIVDVGGYAVTLVERGGIVDVILRFVPHIPFFKNNPTVQGLNESISMVQYGFRAFRNSKNRLQEFKEMCRERELEYVEAVFGEKDRPQASGSRLQEETID